MAILRLDTSSVAWREVDDEIVAIDLKTSQYLTVNEVGRFLWLKLAEGSDEASLTSALAEEARLDAAQASHDVATFLNDLRIRNLLLESDR